MNKYEIVEALEEDERWRLSNSKFVEGQKSYKGVFYRRDRTLMLNLWKYGMVGSAWVGNKLCGWAGFRYESIDGDWVGGDFMIGLCTSATIGRVSRQFSPDNNCVAGTDKIDLVPFMGKDTLNRVFRHTMVHGYREVGSFKKGWEEWLSVSDDMVKFAFSESLPVSTIRKIRV